MTQLHTTPCLQQPNVNAQSIEEANKILEQMISINIIPSKTNFAIQNPFNQQTYSVRPK